MFAFLKGWFSTLLNYCRDTMGWLSVEKKAFQDGRLALILERYWGNGMSLVSPKLEDNQCPAAGCPWHLTNAKSGWLG